MLLTRPELVGKRCIAISKSCKSEKYAQRGVKRQRIFNNWWKNSIIRCVNTPTSNAGEKEPKIKLCVEWTEDSQREWIDENQYYCVVVENKTVKAFHPLKKTWHLALSYQIFKDDLDLQHAGEFIEFFLDDHKCIVERNETVDVTDETEAQKLANKSKIAKVKFTDWLAIQRTQFILMRSNNRNLGGNRIQFYRKYQFPTHPEWISAVIVGKDNTNGFLIVLTDEVLQQLFIDLNEIQCQFLDIERITSLLSGIKPGRSTRGKDKRPSSANVPIPVVIHHDHHTRTVTKQLKSIGVVKGKLKKVVKSLSLDQNKSLIDSETVVHKNKSYTLSNAKKGKTKNLSHSYNLETSKLRNDATSLTVVPSGKKKAVQSRDTSPTIVTRRKYFSRSMTNLRKELPSTSGNVTPTINVTNSLKTTSNNVDVNNFHDDRSPAVTSDAVCKAKKNVKSILVFHSSVKSTSSSHDSLINNSSCRKSSSSSSSSDTSTGPTQMKTVESEISSNLLEKEEVDLHELVDEGNISKTESVDSKPAVSTENAANTELKNIFDDVFNSTKSVDTNSNMPKETQQHSESNLFPLIEEDSVAKNEPQLLENDENLSEIVSNNLVVEETYDYNNQNLTFTQAQTKDNQSNAKYESGSNDVTNEDRSQSKILVPKSENIFSPLMVRIKKLPCQDVEKGSNNNSASGKEGSNCVLSNDVESLMDTVSMDKIENNLPKAEIFCLEKPVCKSNGKLSDIIDGRPAQVNHDSPSELNVKNNANVAVTESVEGPNDDTIEKANIDKQTLTVYKNTSIELENETKSSTDSTQEQVHDPHSHENKSIAIGQCSENIENQPIGAGDEDLSNFDIPDDKLIPTSHEEMQEHAMENTVGALVSTETNDDLCQSKYQNSVNKNFEEVNEQIEEIAKPKEGGNSPSIISQCNMTETISGELIVERDVVRDSSLVVEHIGTKMEQSEEIKLQDIDDLNDEKAGSTECVANPAITQHAINSDMSLSDNEGLISKSDLPVNTGTVNSTTVEQSTESSAQNIGQTGETPDDIKVGDVTKEYCDNIATETKIAIVESSSATESKDISESYQDLELNVSAVAVNEINNLKETIPEAMETDSDINEMKLIECEDNPEPVKQTTEDKSFKSISQKKVYSPKSTCNGIVLLSNVKGTDTLIALSNEKKNEKVPNVNFHSQSNDAINKEMRENSPSLSQTDISESNSMKTTDIHSDESFLVDIIDQSNTGLLNPTEIIQKNTENDETEKKRRLAEKIQERKRFLYYCRLHHANSLRQRQRLLKDKQLAVKAKVQMVQEMRNIKLAETLSVNAVSPHLQINGKKRKQVDINENSSDVKKLKAYASTNTHENTPLTAQVKSIFSNSKSSQFISKNSQINMADVLEDKKASSGSNSILNRPKFRAQFKEKETSFVQDASCQHILDIRGVHTKIPKFKFKCMECRKSRGKKNNQIFCRFYGIRKLRFDNGNLVQSGFLDPEKDCNTQDLRLWLPSPHHARPKKTPVSWCSLRYPLSEHSCMYILKYISKQFCNLIKQELEAYSWISNKESIYWKRPVVGVREMCDCCETTMFNLHWMCPTCGFGVCLDCFSKRRNKSQDELCVYDLDETCLHRWAKCVKNKFHVPSSLMPVQIIPSDCLRDLWKLFHEWQRYCGCSQMKPKPTHQRKFVPQQFKQPSKSFSHQIVSSSGMIRPAVKDTGKKAEYKHHYNNSLLRFITPGGTNSTAIFQCRWANGQCVMVSGVHENLNMRLWHPDKICEQHGHEVTKNALVNCMNGAVIANMKIRDFWEGFEDISRRLIDEDQNSMILKLKDWPTTEDFEDVMPQRFRDLMQALPMPEYSNRSGLLNLASRLPSFFAKPDLGPKMYNAYGWVTESNWMQGTTNLHLDISDAVNVMVYVGIPIDQPTDAEDKLFQIIEEADVDKEQADRARSDKPGALWHIFKPEDTDKIRKLIRQVSSERGEDIPRDHDPIHDQQLYLTKELRRRLRTDYGAEGVSILQCEGDSVFIPAGAAHQVFNLYSCIKVAEDFVSPEHITKCFKLTHEFRYLSSNHSNHEDKLQIKSVIYHSVKDVLSSLQWHKLHQDE